jgi:biotin-dependent carboxylase-like uncharacterized protein
VIDVLAAGPFTTVQDLGRPGYASLGVGPSGAADRGSLRLANRLVGNAEGSACLELSFGGFLGKFAEPALIAVTGAPCHMALDNRQIAMNGPVHVARGETLSLSSPSKGLRSYLAVRGGIDVPAVLGSRSTDVLSGIGPSVVRGGSCLPLGTSTHGAPTVGLAPVPPWPDSLVICAYAGPRDDWFEASALTTLSLSPWTVTPDSNRIGLRLSGPVLHRQVHRQMSSEGVIRGSVQVPPDGQPLIFLADHPVTGGYPVIAVVDEDDVDLAAQARPGQTLRFRILPCD